MHDACSFSRYCGFQREVRPYGPRAAEKVASASQGGIIAGVCAGPPCETWSIARETPVHDSTHKRMPRPLRSFRDLWGKCDLAAREFLQIDTGNTLMGFTLHVCFLQALTGGFSLMEHPRNPQEYMQHKDHAASIWRSAILRWFLSTGWFFKQHISQGLVWCCKSKTNHLFGHGSRGIQGGYN